MMELVPYKKKHPPESLLSPRLVRTQKEDDHLKPGRSSSPESSPADNLISVFQPPEL